MWQGLKKRDIANKLLAFFLATILWFFVAGDRQEGAGFDEMRHTFNNIPLSWRNLEENLTVDEMPQYVDITLQGRVTDIAGLTPADLEAYVELSGLEEGRHTVDVIVVAPPGVTTVRLEPSRVELLLEELLTRQMSIEGEITGSPAGGMVVEELNFSPQDVFVKGPNHLVARVDKVLFELDLEGVASDYQANKELKAVDADGEQLNVDLSPAIVEVNVVVNLPEKEVEIEPVTTGDPAPGFIISSLSLDPPVVSIRAPSNFLAEIETISTHPVALDGLEVSSSQEVYLDIPEGVEEVSHEYIRVDIELEEAE